MKFVSFSRLVDIDISPGISGRVFPRESVLHYRTRPNPKLTREGNRSVNPGDAEGGAKYTEQHNFIIDLQSTVNNIILERILLSSPRLYMGIGVA